jgi:hypothetical protein
VEVIVAVPHKGCTQHLAVQARRRRLQLLRRWWS